MYKVEQEFTNFDDNNRVIRQSQHFAYCETLEDAIKNVYNKMKHVASTADMRCVYIWHDGHMIFHAECNDGVWS